MMYIHIGISKFVLIDTYNTIRLIISSEKKHSHNNTPIYLKQTTSADSSKIHNIQLAYLV